MSFELFAESFGLLIRHLESDGRWHRVPTSDKPRKKNGAYVFDGLLGAVRNWATMLNYAVYRPDKPPARIDRGELRAKARELAKEARKRQKDAAELALKMIRLAEHRVPRDGSRWRGPSIDTHPYLMHKGFPKEPCLVLEDNLLVPMRDALAQHLVGVQSIAPDGKKKFLPGQRAKGAVIRLGRARESWLVEGYATGLSVREALRVMHREAEVIVTFSAGNLVHVVGEGVGNRVFADHDASGAGEEAARRSGLPWCMSPQLGDANDLHMQQGIDAVKEVMRTIV